METNLHNSTDFYEKSEPCFFREFLKFVIFAIFSSKIAIFQLFKRKVFENTTFKNIKLLL